MGLLRIMLGLPWAWLAVGSGLGSVTNFFFSSDFSTIFFFGFFFFGLKVE